MRVHSDERRIAYCDLFDTPGDVNLFIVKPGQRTAWHRHQKQTDEFRCIRGTLLVQLYEDQRREWRWLREPSDSCTIPPGLWHGYANVGAEDAYLLMYLDQKYDPTDEERMSEDEVPWSPT